MHYITSQCNFNLFFKILWTEGYISMWRSMRSFLMKGRLLLTKAWLWKGLTPLIWEPGMSMRSSAKQKDLRYHSTLCYATCDQGNVVFSIHQRLYLSIPICCWKYYEQHKYKMLAHKLEKGKVFTHCNSELISRIITVSKWSKLPL